MPEFANQTDPGSAPMASREERRRTRLQIWVWGKQFAARLKANARRIHQFLHARR